MVVDKHDEDEVIPVSLDDVIEITETPEHNTTNEAVEVIDIDIVKPQEVDLNLEDTPFEIQKETVDRMKADAKEAKIAAQGGASSEDEQAEVSGDKKKQKDIMLTDMDEILESFTESKPKILTAIFAALTLIGCFFPFWGIQIEGLPTQHFQNLLTGYMLYGIFGKLFAIGLVAIVVLVLLDLRRWASRVELGIFVCYVIQIALVVIFGPMEYATDITTLRPGLGLIIVLIGQILIFAALAANKKKA